MSGANALDFHEGRVALLFPIRGVENGLNLIEAPGEWGQARGRPLGNAPCARGCEVPVLLPRCVCRPLSSPLGRPRWAGWCSIPSISVDLAGAPEVERAIWWRPRGEVAACLPGFHHDSGHGALGWPPVGRLDKGISRGPFLRGGDRSVAFAAAEPTALCQCVLPPLDVNGDWRCCCTTAWVAVDPFVRHAVSGQGGAPCCVWSRVGETESRPKARSKG